QRTSSLLNTHRVGFDTNGKGIAVATLKNKLPSFNFTFTEIHNEKYRSTPIFMGVSFRGKLRCVGARPGNNWQHPRNSYRSERSGCLRREGNPHQKNNRRNSDGSNNHFGPV